MRQSFGFSGHTSIERFRRTAVSPGRVGRTFLEEQLIHRSSRGDLVSSKSEVVIADALFEAEQEFGIRSFFERSLIATGGSTRWPDFSIEDRHGQTWFWEHCGKLDQPDYAARWKRKLDRYSKHDIDQWSAALPTGRLIVTEDGPSKGLEQFRNSRSHTPPLGPPVSFRCSVTESLRPRSLQPWHRYGC